MKISFWGKALVGFLTLFLIAFSLVSCGLEQIITHPRSPYYVDFMNPEPIYKQDKVIHLLEDDLMVLGLEERDIQYKSLDEIPKDLKRAFIAIEDARFNDHSGYDLKGIARAMWVNLTNREIRQGGSTITQQLARNLFLGHDQSLDRKLLEFALAIKLEEHYTKDEILEMYLNQVYFGNGNYGVEQASNDYFNQSVEYLSLQEASLLAGIVQAPSLYSPVSSWSHATRRQQLVLQRMVELDVITPKDAEDAIYDEVIMLNQLNSF
ncbi:transglycosylase domain-containing protein [Natranaerobius trueperi]|uniref:Penicillin-binding protein 1A n=1 Tax=Natranaerobius trueperi TaxID=759412 RepID=A0A226C034_9FIRM|nr:transglycosylase domain-containing protein [Natranaerobius trueperi]OWZ83809.1 hypothetical protein CDO51_06865 [Natranaerobius trueperi]